MYLSKLRELGITLTDSGRQVCPKCSGDRKKAYEKCLSVKFDREGVLYNCHHCGFRGLVPYKHTAKKLYFKPEEIVSDKPTNEIIEFFRQRKINNEVLKKYKIKVIGNEIVFPYYKNGELVNMKYRTNLPDGKKTFRQEKDTEKTLFGMDEVDTTKPLIFVEGEMDVLALACQGIYAVSVPNGGNDKDLECLTNCYDFVSQFDNYIIAVDNDEVGNKLKENLLSRLLKENCKIVSWGQYKDANEALIECEDLSLYINNAVQLNPDGVLSFVDQYEEIYSSLFEKDSNYYPTGWKQFDEIVKLRTGYLMVVTGYPSRGKSTFVSNLLVKLTKKYGFKHLIASFESTPASAYVEILEMYKEKSLNLLMVEQGNIFDELGVISEHFFRLDTSKQWSIDEIIEKTESMVKKYGIKTLVIDPYNRLKNEYNDREDKYVGSILSKLCMLSKKLDILIIFVAHPKKPDGEETPSMYSISGSSDWYNMCDYGIIVHRDRDKQSEELNNSPIIGIGKVKNHLLGKPSGGSVRLRYNINKRILENIGV